MAEPWLICFLACNREMQPLFLFFLLSIRCGGGGDFGSGSGSKFNCAARVGLGQTISGTGRVRASVLSPCRPLIKSHHAQTSSWKGLPSHFWNRNNVRSILSGLRRKRTGLLLSGPKSSFQMRVNFAFHLEIKVPESGGREERHRIHVAWSPVWSFHSQWWFGLPCHLLVLVLCIFWSPQSTQPSTRKFQSTSCFLLLTSFMEMLI